ncbi:MAG: LexA family transcriptional regulator [Campylobacterales bacterium]|nr:LexA family transcriptional regulator [Campylobacterales bacterium]
MSITICKFTPHVNCKNTLIGNKLFSAVIELVKNGSLVQIYTMWSDAREIYELLEKQRKQLGCTQAEVSFRAFNKRDSAAFQNIKRGSMPSVDRLQALAEALGLELYLGPPRDAPGATSPSGINDKDFAHVPLHDAALEAGDGRNNGTEEIIDFLAFRKDWLRKIGVAPSNAVLARVEGESMQPSIWEKDLVLIDKSRNVLPVRKTVGEAKQRSPIYALLDNGVARVKRIERPSEDQVVLMSDNPDYAPQFMGIESLSLIGKVMWWGHTVRE